MNKPVQHPFDFRRKRPYCPKPNPFLTRKKAMTICAGFKTWDGLVICADTQETLDSGFKFNIPKLIIRPDSHSDTDHLRMIFAGAGIGPFIDKLVDECWEQALKVDKPNTEKIFHAIQQVLTKWHKIARDTYPKGQVPYAELIIGLVCSGGFDLFKSTGSILNRTSRCTFAGVGEPLAHYIEEQTSLYTTSLHEVAALCSYILLNAKNYVEGCGGDMHIAVVRNNGEVYRYASWEAEILAKGAEQIGRTTFHLFAEAISQERFDRDLADVFRMVRSEIKKCRRNTAKKLSISSKTAVLPPLAGGTERVKDVPRG